MSYQLKSLKSSKDMIQKIGLEEEVGITQAALRNVLEEEEGALNFSVQSSALSVVLEHTSLLRRRFNFFVEGSVEESSSTPQLSGME